MAIPQIIFATLPTCLPVVGQNGGRDTVAPEATNGVLTLGIGWTVVLVPFAFVDIQTEPPSFACITFVASATKRSVFIETFGEPMTIVLSCQTLIHVHAFTTVPVVSQLASTCKGSLCVETGRFLVAIVDAFLTFVDVFAGVTIASETCLTFTFKGTLSVDAFCILVARHVGKQTLVQI